LPPPLPTVRGIIGSHFWPARTHRTTERRRVRCSLVRLGAVGVLIELYGLTPPPFAGCGDTNIGCCPLHHSLPAFRMNQGGAGRSDSTAPVLGCDEGLRLQTYPDTPVHPTGESRWATSFGMNWNETGFWEACKLLKTWWPGTESNHRRQPFQGHGRQLLSH
jgi:hypothetical protein